MRIAGIKMIQKIMIIAAFERVPNPTDISIPPISSRIIRIKLPMQTQLPLESISYTVCIVLS